MKRVEVNGIEMGVYLQGFGPPILLVHGFPFDHTMWTPVAPVLESKYRVIAPDLRGFGRSSVTQQTVITMETLADDLNELLGALDIHEKVVLCGLSMGGYVAMQFVRKHLPRLRGLVLCDTRTSADAPEVVKNRLRLADVITGEKRAELADGMIPKLFSPTTLARDAEEVRWVRHMIEETDPRTIAAVSRGMAQRPDTTDQLARVHFPSLVMVGVDDQPTPPSEMREIAASLPAARFVEIPDAGHLSPLEQPGEFNFALCEYLHDLP